MSSEGNYAEILLGNDNGAKVKALQTLLKQENLEFTEELLDQIKKMNCDNDVAVRFWAKKILSERQEKICGNYSASDYTDKETTLTTTELFEKLANATSSFQAIDLIKEILRRDENWVFDRIIVYLNGCADGTVVSFLVKNIGLSFPDEKFLKAITPFIKHPDLRIVANCVEGLAVNTSPKATLLICQLLEHPDHRIKANAAQALFHQKPELARQVITQMLKAQGKPHLIIAACNAIRLIRGEEFLPLLVNVACDPIISEAAIKAIIEIGGEAALGYLEPLHELDDKALNDRVTAAKQSIKINMQLKAAGETVSNAFQASKAFLGVNSQRN